MADHNLEREAIYHILEKSYDIPVIRGRFRIEAVNVDEELAGVLGVPSGRALLVVDRVPCTEPERRVYFQRRYYRCDRVVYELELSRTGDRRDERVPQTEFEPVFKDRNAGD